MNTEVATPCVERRGRKLSLAFAKGADRALRELAEDVQLLELEKVSLAGSDVSHLGLRCLLGKVRALRELDLAYTPTTDAGLKHLGGSGSLEVLNLWRTRVTGEGLCRLSGLASLRSLCLKGTAVDDGGLVHLNRLGSLRSLNLTETAVTEKGVRRLQAALPALAVCW